MDLSWQADRATWDAVLTASPQATFFHSPAWADLFVAGGPGRRVEVLQAHWPDGRRAVVPMGVRRLWRGLVTLAASGMEYGYGGIVASGPLTASEQRALIRACQKRFPDWIGRSHPFDPFVAALGLPALQDDFATRVLPVLSLDRLRTGYNRERLRAMKRYQAQGVSVRVVGDPDPADRRCFERLYDLEVASWRDRGFDLRWARSATWFDRFWHVAKGRVRVAFATVAGDTVGAEVMVQQGRQATGLFLAWDRRFDECRVSTALTEACLQDCFDRGLTQWDFMPSGDNASLDRFKASFGAVSTPIWRFEQASVRRRLLEGLDRSRQVLVSALPRRYPGPSEPHGSPHQLSASTRLPSS